MSKRIHRYLSKDACLLDHCMGWVSASLNISHRHQCCNLGDHTLLAVTSGERIVLLCILVEQLASTWGTNNLDNRCAKLWITIYYYLEFGSTVHKRHTFSIAPIPPKRSCSPLSWSISPLLRSLCALDPSLSSVSKSWSSSSLSRS